MEIKRFYCVDCDTESSLPIDCGHNIMWWAIPVKPHSDKQVAEDQRWIANLMLDKRLNEYKQRLNKDSV